LTYISPSRQTKMAQSVVSARVRNFSSLSRNACSELRVAISGPLMLMGRGIIALISGRKKGPPALRASLPDLWPIEALFAFTDKSQPSGQR